MNRIIGRGKRWGALALTALIVVLFCLISPAQPVAAASAVDYAYLATRTDGYDLAAFLVEEEADDGVHIFVVAEYSDNRNLIEGVTLTGGIPITFFGTYSIDGKPVFDIYEVEDRSSVQRYNVAYEEAPVQGGEYFAVYWDAEGKRASSTRSVSSHQEYQDADDIHDLLSIDPVFREDYYIPGVLLSKNAGMAGVLINKTQAVCLWFDASAFSAEGAAAPSPTPASVPSFTPAPAPSAVPSSAPAPVASANPSAALPASPGADAPNASQPAVSPGADSDTGSDSKEKTDSDEENESEFPSWGKWAIGGGCAVIVAVAVILILRNAMMKKDGNNGYGENNSYGGTGGYGGNNGYGGTGGYDDGGLTVPQQSWTPEEMQPTVDARYDVSPAAPPPPPPPPPVSPAASGCTLTCSRGYMQGRTFSVGPGGATFGRDPGSTVAFPQNPDGPSRGVSWNHALLSWSNGQLVLLDQSSMGTFVKINGQAVRIEKGVPYRLKSGDVFYIGAPDNRFEVHGI